MAGAGLLSCPLEGYITVAAYYVDLAGRPNDGSAMWANVLDAAVLGGLPPALDGRGGSLAVLAIVGLGFDLEQGLAAGGYFLNTGLLGQPFRCFLGQRRYRPAIGGMMLNVQAVSLGGILEFLVV